MKPDEDSWDADDWDIELDRLASRELDLVEERAVLARCESEPELWRDVALALVEHGRLTAVLREHASAARPTGVKAPCAAPTTPGRARWKGIAAALAVFGASAVAGYRVGFDSRPAAPPVVSAPGADPVPPEDEATASQLAALAADLIPQAAQEVLREAGVEVREQPVVYVVDGSDGERWALPERRIHVRLVKQD